MKVAIVGSITFVGYKILESKMREWFDIGQITEIVSGGAQGADQLAGFFANKFKIPLKIFPAEYNKHGKLAGYIRNVEIVKYSDAVACFWDRKSRGTMHDINLAKRYNKSLYIYNF